MQNLISLSLTPQQLEQADAALETLRDVLSSMIALTPQQRRELPKMGGKSETFCRQTLTVLAGNTQIVPPNLGLSDAQADLAALDALRPRVLQLQQLAERGQDTLLALGSDVMSVALEGYGILKVSGRNEALKNARKGLAVRFERTSRKAGGGVDAPTPT